MMAKVTYIAERLIVDKELVVEGDVSFTTGILNSRMIYTSAEMSFQALV